MQRLMPPPRARSPAAGSAASLRSAPGPGAGDAAELLDGLRRLREDCLRVSEYSGSLDIALQKQIRERSLQAIAARREQRLSRLAAKSAAFAASATLRLRLCAFRAWAVRGRRYAVLLSQDVAEVRRLVLLRFWAKWRREVTRERWVTALRHREEEVAMARSQWDDSIVELQRRVLAAREQQTSKALKILTSFTDEGRLRTVFSHWKESRATAKNRQAQERTVMRYFAAVLAMDGSASFARCFTQWRGLILAARERRGADPHSVEMDQRTQALAAMMAEKELHVISSNVLRAWREAARELRAEKQREEEEREQEKRLEAMKEAEIESKRHLLKNIVGVIFEGPGDVRPSFDAWREAAWNAHIHGQEVELAERKEVMLQWEVRHEHVYNVWRDRFAWELTDMFCEVCFAEWTRVYLYSQLEKRRQAEAEQRALLRELQAARHASREHVLRMALGDLAMSLTLGACRSMRAAWQVWNDRPMSGSVLAAARRGSEEDARRSLMVGRAELAGRVAERKRLEDRLSDGHQKAVARRHSAKETMTAWAEYWDVAVCHTAFVAWRLGGAMVKMEKKQELHHQRIGQQISALRARISAATDVHRGSAMQAFAKHHALASVGSVFRGWRTAARDAARERLVEEARQEMEASIEQARREHEAKLGEHRAQREQKVAAALLLRTIAEGTEMLRFIMHDWWSLVAVRKERAKAVFRLYALQQMRRVYDATPWICIACIELWRTASAAAALEAEVHAFGEQTWLATLRGQRHHRLVKEVNDSLRDSYFKGVLSVALVAWKRYQLESVVSKAAENLQTQRRNSELAAQQKMAALTEQRTGLSILAAGRVHQEHMIKDLQLWMLLWRQTTRYHRLEVDLEAREEVAGRLPATQRRFEEAVVERWMERALALRGPMADFRIALRALHAWARLLLERARSRRVARGDATAERACRIAVKRRLEDVMRLAYCGWQTRACGARRRWLEKRRKWLEASLAVVPGLGMMTARSLQRDGDEGGTAARGALGWALEPLGPVAALEALEDVYNPGGADPFARPPSSAPAARPGTALAARPLPAQPTAALPVAFAAAGGRVAGASDAVEADVASFAAKLQRFRFGMGAPP